MDDVTRSKMVSHDPRDAHSGGNLSAIAREPRVVLKGIAEWREDACRHPSSRQHLSSDDCPEDKREDYQNCSVLCYLHHM